MGLRAQTQMESTTVSLILEALNFAAIKHQHQQRKNSKAPPYINHLIEVANLLSSVGEVSDPVTLQAAILHDTLEDTNTTSEELETRFGTEVRSVVEELTDDKTLPKAVRKRLQIETASQMSMRARLVRTADKISNLLGLIEDAPPNWTLPRRRDYAEWTARVVAGCRGCNPPLEKLYDEILLNARRVFKASDA